MSSTVEMMVKDIRDNLSQVSSSQKDEVSVMQAMLNDPNYKVGVYKKDGLVDTYCPSAEAREMVGRIISTTTKVGSQEAKALSNNYQFTKADASTMVGLSKEFINTYVQTGRKLPLGGRQNSDVSLELKVIEEKSSGFPKKMGVDAQGKPIYKIETTKVPEHDGIKASSPCPSWITSKK